MITGAAFTVFVLGLRHGADPDHLAAIDNLTRNSYSSRPLLSRFCGAIFAAGHSVMVLAIAALVGVLGAHIDRHGSLIETIGTWLSIIVLSAIAILNIAALQQGSTRPVGLKARLMPTALRGGESPWLALPVGFLFGFGFETSSQIATYTLAFGQAGIFGALAIGAAFCLGMICTDTFDSVIVHRLVSDRSELAPRTARIWLWSVSLIALGVAGYELAGVLGWKSPIADIYISGTIVFLLVAVFGYLFATTRHSRSVESLTTSPFPPIGAAE